MPVSIRFKGVVGTTAQLESDKYAGRIGFNTTLARYVVYFDATNYATMARRDVLETFAAGIQDSTLTSGRVMLAGTSGRHQTSALFSYITSPSVSFVVGDGVTASQSAISVDAPSTSDALLSLRSANFSRWTLGRIATTLDFALAARNSSGVVIDNPINIVNASAGLITIGGSTARTTNFTGAIQTSGVARISSGGAGTLTTLSTTGLATLAQATVSDIASGSVVLAGTAGRLQGDAGLTYSQAGGVTKSVILGTSAVVGETALVVDSPLADSAGLRIRSAGTTRWFLERVGSLTDFAVSARDAAGTLIDRPINIVNASAGLITIGGSTNRPTTFTGLVTAAQATVSDLTSGRMVSTTTGGRLQALNYVPLGNTTLGVGEPRICSGVVGGNFVALSGLDVTDAGGFAYLQLSPSASVLGSNAAGSTISVQAVTSVTASAPTVNIGNGAASSIANLTVRDVQKTINSTTENIGGNIYNQYTAVTQTGIVTNQSLAGTGRGSRTIGAGRLNLEGSGMELYLCGTYTTDAAPGNATIRIRIGSTTFRTIGSFALDSNITNGIWWIRGRITTRTTGATGTVGGQLMWEHQASSVAGSQVLHIEPSTSTADVTVDLTASQTIDVDWTATDAGTSITCTCFSIDLIR